MPRPSDPLPLRMVTSDDGHILYDANCMSGPSDTWFRPDTWPGACPVTEAGRGAAWFVCLDSGVDAVLRHYRRGGMVARLSRDRYVWTGAATTRAFAECRVLAYLYQQGCRVPRPLAAAWWRRMLTYEAAILVERLPHVQSLAQRVSQSGQLPASDVAGAVGQAIRAMHDAGVWHADLNAHNILIDQAGQAWLIDFDRARATGVVGQRRRQQNLQRLQRSLIKVAATRGADFYNQMIDELNP